jgi:uncharacterized cupin superfamily protein
MFCKGGMIENPSTGERATFLESAQDTEDTGGESLRFEHVVSPRRSVPDHLHSKQEERHEVLSGTLKVRQGKRELSFGERHGDDYGVAYTSHTWQNPATTRRDV